MPGLESAAGNAAAVNAKVSQLFLALKGTVISHLGAPLQEAGAAEEISRDLYNVTALDTLVSAIVASLLASHHKNMPTFYLISAALSLSHPKFSIFETEKK